MTRRLSRDEHARRLAGALLDTSRRYSLGLMARATWKTHMRALWGLVDQRRLRPDVERILGVSGDGMVLSVTAKGGRNVED